MREEKEEFCDVITTGSYILGAAGKDDLAISTESSSPRGKDTLTCLKTISLYLLSLIPNSIIQ